MIVRLTAASLVVLATLAVGGQASAQAAAAECRIETDKPGQLKNAKNALARAIAGIGDPAKSASEAIKELDKNGATGFGALRHLYAPRLTTRNCSG